MDAELRNMIDRIKRAGPEACALVVSTLVMELASAAGVRQAPRFDAPSDDLVRTFYLGPADRRSAGPVVADTTGLWGHQAHQGYMVWKIAAIKQLRDESGPPTARMTLRDAKETVDRWVAEGKFDFVNLKMDVSS